MAQTKAQKEAEKLKKLAQEDNRSAGMQITHLVEKEAKKKKVKVA